MVETWRIGFYTDGPAFDGGTLRRRALGGSETALIQAAAALADRGHRVVVFNNCAQPGVYHGVKYLNWRDFPRYAHGGFDVFIVSRFAAFFNLPFTAGLKVLWNHDTLDKPEAVKSVLDRIDVLMVLSRFHRDNYLTRLRQVEATVFVTRNGVDFTLIDQAVQSASKDPDKLIHASRPERGLKVLLERIWPRLIQARPSLKLYLCGYQVDETDLEPGLKELYGRLNRLIDQSPNVVNLGPLSKREYYRHLAESALMVYPCTFPEISCIAAIEAQACAAPVMATDDFALSETVVSPEFRVPGRPGTEAYDRAFADRALGLLNDPDRLADLADQARSVVRTRYAWPNIAAEWERLFRLTLAAKRSGALEERRA